MRRKRLVELLCALMLVSGCQTGKQTSPAPVPPSKTQRTAPFRVEVSAPAAPALTATKSFTNATPVALSQGPGSPYPTTVNVAGMSGAISQVGVTLRNLSHAWSRDIDALLVGPGGQKMIVLSDAGNNAATNVTLTFADSAAAPVPLTPLVSGVFQPANYSDASAGGDNFPPPAPVGPYGGTLSVFNGTDPNGTWSLYLFDDGQSDAGTLADGWSLTLTTSAVVAPPPPSIPPSGLRLTQYRMVDVDADMPAGKYILQRSADMKVWTDMQSYPTNKFRFTDLRLVNAAGFYRVVPGPATLTVTWDPSPSAMVTNYTVLRGTNAGKWDYSEKVGLVTNAVITNALLPGTVYFFAVKCEASDGQESGPSNIIMWTNGPVRLAQ